MDLSQMFDDITRARIDLAALAIDESVTLERFAKCEAAASDLKAAVTELLTTAWVPRDPAQLLVTIQSVNKNIERVNSDVAAALDVILLECRPDELYRAFIGLSFSRLLEFQRSVLCDALVNCMNRPCGCGAFEAKGWVN